jgi:uncharacterized glyoxalase superfamily protein PhnB
MIVIPVFAVTNIEEAIDFYCEQLGFETKWRFGEPPHRAGVTKQAVEIHLDAEDAGAPPGPSVVYFHMEDAAKYVHELQTRGVIFLFMIEDRSSGMRCFGVDDLFGNRLGFASKS